MPAYDSEWKSILPVTRIGSAAPVEVGIPRGDGGGKEGHADESEDEGDAAEDAFDAPAAVGLEETPAVLGAEGRRLGDGGDRQTRQLDTDPDGMGRVVAGGRHVDGGGSNSSDILCGSKWMTP